MMKEKTHQRAAVKFFLVQYETNLKSHETRDAGIS
jgi:hypothetical protein